MVAWKLFSNNVSSSSGYFNSRIVENAIFNNSNFFFNGSYYYFFSCRSFSFSSLLFVTASEERHAEYNSKH